VPWWTWIALGLFALAFLATTIFAAWAFGRLNVLFASGEALAVRLEDLSRQAEEIQRRSERTSLRTQELQQRLDRVDSSVKQLGVLHWALRDVSRSLMRARRAYLRK
jgi:hypothetical protein